MKREDVKPHIRLESVRLLCDIDRYIREFDKPGYDRRWLPSAASDVLDGAVDREEIDDLIRRRLLTVIHDGETDEYGTSDSLCGNGWTVHLTERAIKAFWPASDLRPLTAREKGQGKP